MILITAFEPFLGQKTNSSKEILQFFANSLQRTEVEGNKNFETLILPVSYRKSFENLKNQIQSKKYELVILTGQGSGRQKIGIEKCGLNLMDSLSPDEDGEVKIDQPLSEGGPNALFSKLDTRKIWQNLESQWPGRFEISYSAAAYVCNSLYFQCLYAFPELPSLFIHFPIICDEKVDLKIGAAAIAAISNARFNSEFSGASGPRNKVSCSIQEPS